MAAIVSNTREKARSAVNASFRERTCTSLWWFHRSRTAEMQQLPRNENDKGVGTLLTQAMTPSDGGTFLVNFNHRIVAVGELLMKLR